MKPFISCITTFFKEGLLVEKSIRSHLTQTYEDFELILVDDGADETTREIAHSFDDKRIVHIRQSNDGLSSARNRAITNASGEYLCFLDADDTRPSWALENMVLPLTVNKLDCVFTKGNLFEPDNTIHEFYDNIIFEQVIKLNASDQNQYIASPALMELMLLTEPQSANKLVNKSFLEKYNLRFPNGYFFEDMLFHISIITKLKSFSVIDTPCFTYFRRYGPPQITSSTGLARFDIISVARMVLDMFVTSEYFIYPRLRLSVGLRIFEFLAWCEASISHMHKHDFSIAVKYLMENIHPLYLETLNNHKLVESSMYNKKYHVIDYIRDKKH
jgi:glycosyltransferase involved in cell wall biosynthesis